MSGRRLLSSPVLTAAANGLEEQPCKCTWASGKLEWSERPQNVLIVGKRSDAVTVKVRELTRWLVAEKDMNVFVETWRCIGSAWEETVGENGSGKEGAGDRCPIDRRREGSDARRTGEGITEWAGGRIIEVELSKPSPELLLMLREEIDFAICIGGDGTLLFFNSFFPTSVPPVICVNYTGSLGFLTRFRMEDIYDNVERIIAGEMEISNRTRMSATVRVTRAHALEAQELEEEERPEELAAGDPALEVVDGISYTFINEVVIDRGPSPFISSLECFCDGTHITTVQGDGIIIATSTGSTAYSLAAGGSMLHPLLSAVIFTPICPHSLSFRPVVLPGTAKLRIQVPSDSRSSAWVRFDGKQRFQLRREDSVAIEMAEYPLPMICKSDMTSEWFSALANCLSWNIRERQGKL
mmetsp:Transcript_12119/g.48763  ORF Transcript_12119/g.48763 Transcript_12119/m.48763 type:complete len:411 (-) Transcript_12119:1736-2968(-)